MKLTLAYPTTPFLISQKFGENPEYYKKEFNVNGHNGLDIVAQDGTPVYAAHDGICYPEVDSSGGNGIVLRTLETFDYEDKQVYFKSIYWHLKQADAVVKTGQKVKCGDLIGYADNTGKSTGSHLHFGLKTQRWDENDWQFYNLNQDNGFMGAIDPTPYFTGQYAKDTLPFYYNLSVGMKHPDIRRLQTFLKKLGYFTYSDITDFYGKETAKAVLAFQWSYGLINLWQYVYYGGRYFHERTRMKANEIMKEYA